MLTKITSPSSIFTGNYVSGKIKAEIRKILQAKWVTIEEALKMPIAYNSKSYLETLKNY
jgi:hypothetical protein